MSSLSVCFDASGADATDLLPVLTQVLYATQPSRHGVGTVTLFVDTDASIDWPEVSWLDIVRVDKTAKAPRKDSTAPTASVANHLQAHPESILVSLNSSSVVHPVSLVMVSDFAASQFGKADAEGSLFNRIRHKIDTRHRNKGLEELRGVVVFSCYAISRFSGVEQGIVPKVSIIPKGIDPQFFGPRKEHRMLEDTTLADPFVWLCALTHDSVDATLAIIESIQTLRELGAYVALKLLMPYSVGGHRVDPDMNKRVAKLSDDLPFVEVIKDCEPASLVQHYHDSDGFIWGPRSDRHHQYVLYAMASGLPIVAANSEMIKKHLGPKIRYFKPDDPNDLANALERSMADIHFRIIGGGLNHKRSMSYTWEKTAADFFRLIRAYGEITSESRVLVN